MSILRHIFEGVTNWYYAEQAQNSIHFFKRMGLEVITKAYAEHGGYKAAFPHRCRMQYLDATCKGSTGGIELSGIGMTETAAIALLKNQFLDYSKHAMALLIPVHTENTQNRPPNFYKVIIADLQNNDEVILIGSIEVNEGDSVFTPVAAHHISLEESRKTFFDIVYSPWKG